MKKLVVVRRLTAKSDVVLVWNETRGCYVKSSRCILLVACPVCRAKQGEPCRGKFGYKGEAHYPRRYLINPKLAKTLLRPLSRYRL